MSVRREGEVIRLEGDCGVEEAEALVALLLDGGGSAVDLSDCRLAHTAVVQALLVHGAVVSGEPREPFLRDYVLPELHRDNRSHRPGTMMTIEKDTRAPGHPGNRS